MNTPISRIESQKKGFSTLYDFLLEKDSIAIISFFTLTSHCYGEVLDMVPSVRTVSKEKFLAAYEQFKQEGYISEQFQSKLISFVSRVQEISREDIKEEYKKTLLEKIECELGDFIYWENEGLFDKRIAAQFGGGKGVPKLEIKDGEIRFLIDSHNVQGNTTSAVEEVILGINQ